MPLARLAAALLIAALPVSVAAQDRRPSHCIALVENTPGLAVIQPASFREAVPDDTVRINYIDHAMFLIQTPDGTGIVTDYNGFLGPEDIVPDVVTMNRAHSTHWTANPDPRIPHVLPGWTSGGDGPADHHLDLGEVLIRNVPTDIRSPWGDGAIASGNSIFIFETAGLCVGHLGHLHHVPTPEQFAAIGRLDVVMAPVDGGMTLSLPDMISVLKRLRSSVVIPMHWFSGAGLGAFLEGMQDTFRIDIRNTRDLTVSLRTLPSEPTIVVLQPRFLGFNDSP